jgi:hypothetical protein
MVGAGVDEVRETELPDVAESLQERGVKQGKKGVLDLHVPVDGILDDLCTHPEEQSSFGTIKNTSV